MNCDESRSLFLASEFTDQVLAHFESCPACRSIRADLETDRITLGDPATWEEPSSELEDQIVALVGGTQRDESRRDGWPQRVVRPLAAAAAVVVVFGLFAVLRTPSPDWEVEMPGTDLAVQATSIVRGWNTEAGTRMILTVDGLDPAPAGYVYEFWLSEGPLHISAGTFAAGGEIELWSGVRRSDFPRLWVTLEPVDDDESPSGTTVLDTEA